MTQIGIVKCIGQNSGREEDVGEWDVGDVREEMWGEGIMGNKT